MAERENKNKRRREAMLEVMLVTLAGF